ncbi:uncharacterized protein LOC119109532 [Pollicipes pollicipes]|uniref:uncharacterized protein LOC119109532 n=1 Tax=Pollicipes pollicipes TaxID=41117 RepID=UPI001884FCBC|nr:uncharacterized protein LOC119109532 [Pollicipes pollicipes]
MWPSTLCVLLAMSLPVPCLGPGTHEAFLHGTGRWRLRPKREEVLVPDWILAEGCHVENCAELIGREAPENYRNASHVKMHTPLLLSSPSPGRVRFPGGQEVAISSTELRNHLANTLCCQVNEVTHVTDRASRLKLMTAFYENVISWLEELLIPTLSTEQYVSVEEREAVSRLTKDLGVLQQDRYVPAFYLDATEAREREEEWLHLRTIGLIVACAVGGVLLTAGLLFCVLMARGKKRAVARQQGEMEPLLEGTPAPQTPTASGGSESTPEQSLGQDVVSRGRLDTADDPGSAYTSGSSSTPGRSVNEITVSVEDTSRSSTEFSEVTETTGPT